MGWLTGSLYHVSDGLVNVLTLMSMMGWLTGSLCHVSDGLLTESPCHQ